VEVYKKIKGIKNLLTTRSTLGKKWHIQGRFNNMFPSVITRDKHSIEYGCLVTKHYEPEILGFWTLFIIWYSRKHNVSETGSVSILR
jgi:hypothetical protein